MAIKKKGLGHNKISRKTQATLAPEAACNHKRKFTFESPVEPGVTKTMCQDCPAIWRK